MKPAVIGLTGGIGSGKTTIAGHFSGLGVPVYIADDEAKKILYTSAAIAEIRQAFGESAFTGNVPDRAKIAGMVFGDPAKLQMLNDIIHPKVREHFVQWVGAHDAHKFVIKEAAILFESGSYKDCDKVILVTAPREIRIQRVMQRDNVSRESVLQRMAAQWDDTRKLSLSDYVIDNTNAENAKKQVLNVFELLNAE